MYGREVRIEPLQRLYVGKKIVVVANLKPAVLCGVESNGMILASGDGDDIKVVFLDDTTPLGQRIR